MTIFLYHHALRRKIHHDHHANEAKPFKRHLFYEMTTLSLTDLILTDTRE